MRKVVITGRGILLPWGQGPQALQRLSERPPAESPAAVAFEPREFVPNPRILRAMHRGFQLAAAAAALAMREAGLPEAASLPAAGLDAERAGIAVAAMEINPATADLISTLEATPQSPDHSWSEFGQAALHGLHPFRRLGLLTNMAAAHVSILFGLRGPSLTLTSGPRAGQQILREAYWLIAENRADFMVCETADCPAHSLALHSRAEAGAALALEAYDSALARNAPVWAEVCSTAPTAGVSLAPGWARYFPVTAPLLAAAQPFSSDGTAVRGGLEFKPPMRTILAPTEARGA